MKRSLLPLRSVAAFFLVILIPSVGLADEPVKLTLSQGGKAALNIVINSHAGDATRRHAAELAAALERITGATFQVKTSDTPAGIAVGTDTEWPGFLRPVADGRPETLSREDYLLRTSSARLLVIGRADLGVQDAVWGLLQRAGFRQFFPGPDWEIWPHDPDLAVTVDQQERPSFATRKIGFGYSILPEDRAMFDQWSVRNRMVSGFDLQTGHSYSTIVSSNPAYFKEHPEDIVPNGGKINSKLDPSQQTTLDAALAYALTLLKKTPTPDCVSMEPSDGGGWRTDSPLGSPSNQAVTLANYVAHGIQVQFPGRKVGMYAYNLHGSPPDIQVDPNVIVSIATAFIHGGYSPEELIKEWRAKGADIGIREYLSVWPWELDLPGKARDTQLDYLSGTISRFHQMGINYWVTEASNGWGVNGLGYYLTSRYLWNADETKNTDALTDDFYQRAFGPAHDEMRDYFQKYILASGHPLISEDLLGHMYRSLSAALDKAGSPDVKRRILDLAIYTRYVELMSHYLSAKDTQHQEAYDEVAKFVYETRGTNMVNYCSLFRDTPPRDKQLRPVNWADADPLKVETTISDADVEAFVTAGIATNQLAGFEPVSFSSDLVPFSGPASDAPAPGATTPLQIRGTNSLYLQMPDSGSVQLTVRGGLIRGTNGPVHLRLFSHLSAIGDAPVATADIPPDQQGHDVTLKSPEKGLHRLEISDGNDLTEISWPEGLRAGFPSSPETTTRFNGTYSLVFVVPAGTKIIGGYTSASHGVIKNAQGSTVFDFHTLDRPGYFSAPVQESASPAVWRLESINAPVVLLTVPPYLSRDATELIVPKETLAP